MAKALPPRVEVARLQVPTTCSDYETWSLQRQYSDVWTKGVLISKDSHAQYAILLEGTHMYWGDTCNSRGRDI